MSKNELLNSIVSIPCVFWDFDGVIKESIEAKSNAFKLTFVDSSPETIKKITEHHQKNGGMSRYEKIPLYLEWSKVPNNQENIERYCSKFSKNSRRMVIASPWIEGVLEVISMRYKNGLTNIIITATPQGEMEEIVNILQIDDMFSGIYGSPMSKTNSLKLAISEKKIDYDNSIMIGDAITDYDAAIGNKVKFILRKTEFNSNLQELCKGRIINNFIYE